MGWGKGGVMRKGGRIGAEKEDGGMGRRMEKREAGRNGKERLEGGRVVRRI